MEPSIFKKLCDLFIGLSFWEQVLFACLVFIILLIVPCCIICWIRTKSLSNAFAWASVPAFRASQLYWRLRVVRDGKMSYDKFLKKYSKIHIKDYDIEKREKPVEHANTLYWNDYFRELVYERRDLVEKYMMGPRFSRKMYKQLIKELDLSESSVAKDEIDPEVKVVEQQDAPDGSSSITHNDLQMIDLESYKCYNDLFTDQATEEALSKLHIFFAVDNHRNGKTIYLAKVVLEVAQFINPVNLTVYYELFSHEFRTPQGYSAIADAKNRLGNLDDLSDENREIVESIASALDLDAKKILESL